ncbi:hypothetical protein L195_g052200, partial [Trifolium pratense]
MELGLPTFAALLLNIFLLIPSLNLTETRTVKAEASINLRDFMAANISVSETGYLLTLYDNAAKGVDIIIWPNIVYQSRVQCTVESQFQLPWLKLDVWSVTSSFVMISDLTACVLWKAYRTKVLRPYSNEFLKIQSEQVALLWSL